MSQRSVLLTACCSCQLVRCKSVRVVRNLASEHTVKLRYQVMNKEDDVTEFNVLSRRLLCESVPEAAAPSRKATGTCNLELVLILLPASAGSLSQYFIYNSCGITSTFAFQNSMGVREPKAALLLTYMIRSVLLPGLLAMFRAAYTLSCSALMRA